jgi:hypothetical protein
MGSGQAAKIWIEVLEAANEIDAIQEGFDRGQTLKERLRSVDLCAGLGHIEGDRLKHQEPPVCAHEVSEWQFARRVVLGQVRISLQIKIVRDCVVLRPSQNSRQAGAPEPAQDAMFRVAVDEAVSPKSVAEAVKQVCRNVSVMCEYKFWQKIFGDMRNQACTTRLWNMKESQCDIGPHHRP